MALKNRFDGKVVFLNATNGRLQNKKENLYGDQYEGVLVGIRIRDTEYKNEKGKAIELRLKDEENKELAFISFNALSWTAQNFFSRLPKLNLDKPFTFGVQGVDYNEKLTYVYIMQDGKPVTPVENAVGPEKVKVNGKPTNDWSAVLEHAEQVIKELQETRFKKSDSKTEEVVVESGEDEENIPF